MREFLKLIVSVIVIIVIVYTLYFFLSNNANYQAEYISGDIYISGEDNIDLGNNKSGNNNSENNNSKKNNEVDQFIEIDKNDAENKGEQNHITNNAQLESGELSGEKAEKLDENLSGDIEDFEEKISKINMIETKNRLANLTNSLEDSVGIDTIGTKNKEYLDSLSSSESIGVTVQIAGSMVYIIPTPDFVDNAQYHYDENGNLALYICELTGIGGEIRYYFQNNTLLTQVNNVEEDVEVVAENTQEIVNRAKLIYDKYMK